MRSFARVLAALSMFGVAIAAGSWGSGCGPACPATERVVDEGQRWTAGSTRYYQTSGADGPFLPFEGATLLHLRHGLGRIPDNVQIMLSFDEHPLGSGGGYTYAAGNQAKVLRQDENEVSIRNDSCASYWIRVSMQASEKSDAAAAETAPTDTGATDTGATDTGATD